MLLRLIPEPTRNCTGLQTAAAPITPGYALLIGHLFVLGETRIGEMFEISFLTTRGMSRQSALILMRQLLRGQAIAQSDLN